MKSEHNSMHTLSHRVCLFHRRKTYAIAVWLWVCVGFVSTVKCISPHSAWVNRRRNFLSFNFLSIQFSAWLVQRGLDDHITNAIMCALSLISLSIIPGKRKEKWATHAKHFFSICTSMLDAPFLLCNRFASSWAIIYSTCIQLIWLPGMHRERVSQWIALTFACDCVERFAHTKLIYIPTCSVCWVFFSLNWMEDWLCRSEWVCTCMCVASLPRATWA